MLFVEQHEKPDGQGCVEARGRSRGAEEHAGGVEGGEQEGEERPGFPQPPPQAVDACRNGRRREEREHPGWHLGGRPLEGERSESLEERRDEAGVASASMGLPCAGEAGQFGSADGRPEGGAKAQRHEHHREHAPGECSDGQSLAVEGSRPRDRLAHRVETVRYSGIA